MQIRVGGEGLQNQSTARIYPQMQQLVNASKSPPKAGMAANGCESIPPPYERLEIAPLYPGPSRYRVLEER